MHAHSCASAAPCTHVVHAEQPLVRTAASPTCPVSYDEPVTVQAAERAELSALEVQQQSETDGTAGGNGATPPTAAKPSGSTNSSSPANRWGLWTLCWQLGRIVLNRLQLTVNNVHLSFQVWYTVVIPASPAASGI
jgi:hypothetical protein